MGQLSFSYNPILIYVLDGIPISLLMSYDCRSCSLSSENSFPTLHGSFSSIWNMPIKNGRYCCLLCYNRSLKAEVQTCWICKGRQMRCAFGELCARLAKGQLWRHSGPKGTPCSNAAMWHQSALLTFITR